MSALDRPFDGAVEADPLDLVERWLAEASEVSWGSDRRDGGWANMPKRYLEAVAAEARRSRETLKDKLVITPSPDLQWFPGGGAAAPAAIPYLPDSFWLRVQKRIWWLRAWLPWMES